MLSYVGRFGVRVSSRLTLLYIHHMNRVNSYNVLVVMTAPWTSSEYYYCYYYYVALRRLLLVRIRSDVRRVHCPA